VGCISASERLAVICDQPQLALDEIAEDLTQAGEEAR
jgi:hypothetical protein